MQHNDMSMELMVQAMKARVGNPLRKLVLLKLADNANERGECWPSYQHIADQCEISKRSAMNHVDALAEAGLLRKVPRKGPKGNTSNVYILSLPSAGDSPGVVQEIHQGGAGDSLGSAGDSLGGGAGDSPRTSHSFEPVIEPVTEPQGVREKKYPDDFESAWRIYPKREGSNPKNRAYSAWKARTADGVTAEVMTQGVKRYAAYCAARGTVGTNFVMQAQRFFGPSGEYENDWVVVAAPQGQGPPKFGDELRNRSLLHDLTDKSWAR